MLDTLADWEAGYITAELNTGRYFKPGAVSYSVKTIAGSKAPITTMGGLRIFPDYTIDEVQLEDAGLLLLPGADIWSQPQHAPVFDVVKQCLDAGVVVAAICGATVALANAGILDQHKHTSNDLSYLLQTLTEARLLKCEFGEYPKPIGSCTLRKQFSCARKYRIESLEQTKPT